MSGAAWLGQPLLRAEPHAAVSRRVSCVRASPRSLPRAFSSCCPASYVLGSAALQRQAGCPDPAPRSELDPCFWDAVPDASGAGGRLRRAQSTRVTRTLEFGRVCLSRRRPRYVPKSLRLAFGNVEPTRSKHAARTATAPTILSTAQETLAHCIVRALEDRSARLSRRQRTHNTPVARQQHARRRQRRAST